MPSQKLSDSQVRSAKPREAAYKLFDGGGLFLAVTPKGAKSWRLQYRLHDKQQTATLGLYPEVTLAAAREKAFAIRRDLAAGRSPKARKSTMTFKQACTAYWGGRRDLSLAYLENVTSALERHLYGDIGDRAVESLTREDLLKPLNRMNAAGLFDYVRKVRMWSAQVFDWVIEQGLLEVNPARTIKPKVAFGRRAVEPFASVAMRDVPTLVQRLDMERPELLSVLGCWLMAYTWVRTQELRMMQWDQIEGDVWRVPAGTMKARREHLVPLSRQALDVLAKLEARRTSRFVFPGDRSKDRPMSENAVLALLARIGFKGEMTGHGWRKLGSTWANERELNADAIEMQLAHLPASETRAAYNLAKYLTQRRAILQAWADWLDDQRSPQPPASNGASPSSCATVESQEQATAR